MIVSIVKIKEKMYVLKVVIQIVTHFCLDFHITFLTFVQVWLCLCMKHQNIEFGKKAIFFMIWSQETFMAWYLEKSPCDFWSFSSKTVTYVMYIADAMN